MTDAEGTGDEETVEKGGESSAPSGFTAAERIFVRISVLQTILAVAGMFTGAVALWAALNESDAVRKQQLASVWPHIRVTDLSVGTPGEERFDVIVGNRGIGPARIVSARVTVDGEDKTSWFEAVDVVAGEASYGLSHAPIAGVVMAPNEDITIVSLDAQYGGAELTKAFRDLVRSGRANMTVCYCSVFDDCYRLDVIDSRTSETKTCAPPDPNSEI